MSKRRHQVKSACTQCRKQHTRCDNSRPCSCCVQLGIESTCSDAPKKRRKLSYTHYKSEDFRKEETSVQLFNSTFSVAPLENVDIVPLQQTVTLSTSAMYPSYQTVLQHNERDTYFNYSNSIKTTSLSASVPAHFHKQGAPVLPTTVPADIVNDCCSSSKKISKMTLPLVAVDDMSYSNEQYPNNTLLELQNSLLLQCSDFDEFWDQFFFVNYSINSFANRPKYNLCSFHGMVHRILPFRHKYYGQS